MFSSALLTGKTIINASSRTTLNSEINANNHVIDNNSAELIALRTQKVKKMASDLIHMVNNGTNDFETMRSNNNQEFFETFVEYCLIHSTTAVEWRYKCYNTILSKIFTISDEALTMLMLENNVADLVRIKTEQNKLTRKESKPKYTKVNGDTGERYQGWHKKGIKRYNELYNIVKAQRETQASKELELVMKDKFANICGKVHTGGEGLQSDMEDDEENNIDSDDEVFAIDAFAEESVMPSLDRNAHLTPV